MSRPVQSYRTVFWSEGHPGAEVILDTAGETPCAAKNLGFKLLEWYLKQHPELPTTGWFIREHTQMTFYA